VKPKTARRFLMRNRWKLASMKFFDGGKRAREIVSSYLRVLKQDLDNPATIRVWNLFVEFSIR